MAELHCFSDYDNDNDNDNEALTIVPAIAKRSGLVEAPKGRDIPAQGNALGMADNRPQP